MAHVYLPDLPIFTVTDYTVTNVTKTNRKRYEAFLLASFINDFDRTFKTH